MQFSAIYFDGQKSKPQSVSVLIDEEGLLTLKGLAEIKVYQWEDVKVSSQIGSISRSLYFPDGSKCETNAHATINELLARSKRDLSSRLLHVLESRLKYVIVATVFVIAFSGLMIVFGIPALASKVAYSLPPSVDASLANGSMELLDKFYMDPSVLPQETQTRLIAKFEQMVKTSEDEHDYELLFRSSEIFGPNAFALPSGTIVLTDQLVDLAENDEELISIMAHEIGHVVHRHSMRSVLQNSAVALVLIAVTGDAFSSSAFSAALPLLLIQAKFSREFENEADHYSYDYLVKNNLDLHHFANILQRITDDQSLEIEESFKYLSTHPITSERIKKFADGK